MVLVSAAQCIAVFNGNAMYPIMQYAVRDIYELEYQNPPLL